MSKRGIYEGLKADLMTVSGVKKAGLWNNHLARENVEHAFLYPAVFVEFMDLNFTEQGRPRLIQYYEMTVRLHICFESYKDEDFDVLDLVDKVWSKVQGKTYDNSSALLRREEAQDFDHPNVQVYTQDYFVRDIECVEGLGGLQEIGDLDPNNATLDPVVTGDIIDKGDLC